MNLSNFLEVPPGEGWEYPFDPAHIDAIAAAGFDTIRIPANAGMRWTGDRIDPVFRAALRLVVERARAAGLFVIVDLHHYTALMDDSEGRRDEFLAVWEELAEMFDDMPDSVAFELLNEPREPMTTQDATPLYEAALEIIRARQRDRWVIFGAGEWNSYRLLAELPGTDDPFVVHTFHYYEPYDFTHQLAEWATPRMPARPWGTVQDRAAVESDFDSIARHPTPLFLGEFGVFREAAPADRAAWIGAVRRAAEQRGIGWCHWGFGADFRAFDPATGSWNETVLEALMD